VAGRVNPIRNIGRSVQKKQRRHNYHDHLDNSIISEGMLYRLNVPLLAFTNMTGMMIMLYFTYRHDCWNPR